jgi:hypothetical protein
MDAFVKVVSQAWVYANSGALALGVLLFLLNLIPSGLENALDPLLYTCLFRRGKLLRNLLAAYATQVPGDAQPLGFDAVTTYLTDTDRYSEYRGAIVRLRSLAVFATCSVPVAAGVAVLALLIAGLWESARPAMAVVGVCAVGLQPVALLAAVYTRVRIHRLRIHPDFCEIPTP